MRATGQSERRAGCRPRGTHRQGHKAATGQAASRKRRLQIAGEVATSPFVVSLLQRETQLASQEAHLIKTYGKNHPLSIQAGAERDGLPCKINRK